MSDIQKLIQSDQLWRAYLIVDIEYLIDIFGQLPIHIDYKVVDKSVQQVIRFLKDGNEIDSITYQILMQNVLNSIEDDHASIEFNTIMQDSHMQFGNFVSKWQQDQLQIILSTTKSLKVGNVIVEINGKPTLHFLKSYIKHYLNNTESFQLKLLRASLLVGKLNPLMRVTSLGILQPKSLKIKTVQLTYTKILSGYFGGNTYEKFMFKHIFKPLPAEFNSLDIREGKMSYMQLHTFQQDLQDELRLNKYLKSLKSKKWIDYIVIDMRQNRGGTTKQIIDILRQLLSKNLWDLIATCTTVHNAVSKDFFQKYLEQVIIPVKIKYENDKDMQKLITRHVEFYKEIQKHYNFYNDSEIHKTPKKYNNIIKKIAESFINKTKKFKTIVIVNDLVCYSACIWAVNFLSLFPNVIIVGKQIGITNGSGNMLTFQLPSKMAQVGLPQVSTLINNSNILNHKQKPDIYLSDEILENKSSIMYWMLQNKQQVDRKVLNKSRNALNNTVGYKL